MRSRSRTSSPRPGDARRLLAVGEVHEQPFDVLVDRRGEQRERLVGGLLGSERRIAGVRAEHRVHRADDLAQAPHALEERVRVVAELFQRQLPAVARAGDEVLEHAQRRVEVAALDLVPAGQAGDVGEAALGQEARDLEVRVDARLDAAEDLEDQLVTEDDRRVGLLGADRAGGSGGVRDRHVVERAEADDRLVVADVGVLADQLEQHLGVVGQPIGRLVPAADQLVGLVGARAEDRIDERGADTVAKLDFLEDVAVGDLASLGAEPALLHEELGEAHQPSSSTSWNQKNPRGASVSR